MLSLLQIPPFDSVKYKESSKKNKKCKQKTE